jgi:Flp pilus assembly protein TadD
MIGYPSDRPQICIRLSMRTLPILALMLLAACQPQDASDAALNEQDKAGLQAAEAARQSGDLAKAGKLYEQLAARDDSSAAVYIAMASNYRRMGKPQEAAATLRKAQTRYPGDPKLLSQLGYALIAAKKPEEAVLVFDELIAMQPDNASAYNGKAVAFDHAGNHVAAQEIYQKALSLAPSSTAIRNNQALSLILSDEIDEAIARLEPLTRSSSATATMRQNLALAYGLKGNRERARELNLKDVSEQQANENLRFYEKYAHLRSAQNASPRADEMQSAFTEINDADSGMEEAKAPPVAPMSIADEAAPIPGGAAEPVTAEPVKEEKAIAKPAETIQEKPPEEKSVTKPALEVIAESAPAAGESEAESEEDEPDKEEAGFFGKDATPQFPSGERR